MVEAIDNQNIGATGIRFDKVVSVCADHAQTCIVFGDVEMPAEREHLGIDLHGGYRAIGYVTVAEFYNRAAAQTDHLDPARGGVEKQASHYYPCVIENEARGLLGRHHALDSGPIRQEDAQDAEIEDHRTCNAEWRVEREGETAPVAIKIAEVRTRRRTVEPHRQNDVVEKLQI